MHYIAFLILLITFSINAKVQTYAATEHKSVQQFIEKMAQKHNFSKDYLQQIFASVNFTIWDKKTKPPKKRPPKPSINWQKYRTLFLTESRIDNGIKFWETHKESLEKAEKIFQVPANIIVAVLGIESNYGNYQGKFQTFNILTRKAFNGYRRSRFYQKELEHFLLLARDNLLEPLLIYGSHAGAMGYGQFISSSYRHYAIDFDNDNKVDLFNSPADAIGSIANYFARHNWQANALIATLLTEVEKTTTNSLSYKPIKPKTSIASLRKKGLQIPLNINKNQKAHIITLANDNSLEHWLSFNNFYAITRYNHSNLYAMAVYQLSQALKQGFDSL